MPALFAGGVCCCAAGFGAAAGLDAADEAAGAGDAGAAGAEVLVAAGVDFAAGAAALVEVAAGAGVEVVEGAGVAAFTVADFFEELRDFFVVDAESVVAFASVAGAAPDVPLAAVALSDDADFFDLVELFLEAAAVDLSVEAVAVESVPDASDFFDFDLDFELVFADESLVAVADD